MSPGRGPAGYAVLQTIGHGASSTVYEAVQTSTKRRVALKILTASAPECEANQLYARERAVMAALGDHPNVVSLVDAGEWNSRWWLATEHCPYGSVACPRERLSIPDVVLVLAGVASPPAAAHDAGLIHCDVKPANILRTRFGQPALADFGIARLVTATGHGSTTIGYTLDHASPEVLDGERPTGASDVWSLGTTLWELLEGRPPFRRPDEVAQSPVIRRICFDPLPELSRDDAPDALCELIAAMTAKASQERPRIEAVVDHAKVLQAEVGLPDPAGWSQTIVPPLAHAASGPEAEVAPAVDDGAAPDMPDHTVMPGRLLQDRPRYREDEPSDRRQPVKRPWAAVVTVALALVLVAGSGMATWRLTGAASSAPAPPTAPAPVSTPPVPPDRALASPAITSPAPEPPPAIALEDTASSSRPLDNGNGDQGGGSGGAVGSEGDGSHGTDSNPLRGDQGTPSANGDRAPLTGASAGDVRPPVGAGSSSSGAGGGREPAGRVGGAAQGAGIGKVRVTNTTCRFPTGSTACSQKGNRVAFTVTVLDTGGRPITASCSATSRVTKTGKKTAQLKRVPCGSTASFVANGPGQYVIAVTATVKGKSKSHTFSVTVR